MRWRVVVHAHSDWSYDGHWRVGKLARTVSRFGAHILMMSEHSQKFDSSRLAEYRAECAAASTSTMRVIPGIEYSSPGNEIHILTWGLREYLGEEVPVDEILDAITHANGVAIFAHPSRRDVWKSFDPAWARRLDAMEIWNRKSDGLARSEAAWRLIQQHNLAPVASLDFHRLRQLFPLYNVLEAPADLMSLPNEAMLEAIKSKGLEPRFLGMPVDGSNRNSARLARGMSVMLSTVHNLMTGRKRMPSKRRQRLGE